MIVNMPMCCNSNENYRTTTSSKRRWSYLKERFNTQLVEYQKNQIKLEDQIIKQHAKMKVLCQMNEELELRFANESRVHKMMQLTK